MATQKSTQTAPDSAIEALFEEIASTAYLTEERLKVTATDDEDVPAFELDLLRGVVRRLGWIADMGLQRLGGHSSIHKGDAAAWLLAPVTVKALDQRVQS